MVLQRIRCQSSDDHVLPPTSMVLGHTSPTHHQLMHHQHLNAVTTVNYPASAHLHSNHAVSAASTMGQAAGLANNSSTIGYPEDIYGGQDFNELGQSEHYIYVTYPPELKRRLLERYGKEIYLTLLRKDMYD